MITRFAPDDLPCYIDFALFDETPMRTSQKGDGSCSAKLVAGAGQGSSDKDLMELAYAASLDDAVRSQGVSLKFLQTRQKYGMLLQCQSGLLAVFGNANAPLQIVERTTAQVLKQTLLQNSSMSVWANQFPVKVRASCTDKAPENSLAERGLLAERDEGWLYCHSDCEVHLTSTCVKKTYQSLLPDQISGLIRTALSLQKGGTLTLFRQALKSVIRRG